MRILSHLQLYREDRPRHFAAMALMGGASLLAMVTAFAIAPSSLGNIPADELVVEQLSLPHSRDRDFANDLFVREERIQRGDTVGRLFSRLGIDDEPAMAELRKSAEADQMFRQMRPGKTVTARTGRQGELVSLVFPLNGGDQALMIERDGNGFSIEEQALQLETQLEMRSGEIRSSLFAATDQVGLPDAVAMQLADIFGGDIDFHRDIRKGDQFSVVYETLRSLGQTQRAGRVLAAEFTNQGKIYRAFYFQNESGSGGYYGDDGRSIRKAFLRSPLEFSRISSGFSMRMHPVLHTRRAHKGIDYAAPAGTRVKASGDGVVEFAGRQGGYGNLVILRHQNRYTTYYGHLRGFAPGIHRGARVQQGDIVGYVGATGLATGPHLHYEFRVNDVHQNPLTIALPTAAPLSRSAIVAFKERTEPLAKRLELMNAGQIALAD